MSSAKSSEILPRLALLLNSTHDFRHVIALALKHFKEIMHAEAVTLFLKGSTGKELIFWASQGGSAHNLEGETMPLRGIVGWSIEKNQSLIVPDVTKDPRFFSDIDEETSFRTRDILCVPLVVRGGDVIGAIEALNSMNGEGFTPSDLEFAEHYANLSALAVDNAKLITSLELRTKELSELNKKKDDVLMIIAHEFRTPLNIIQMSTDLLQNGLVKKEEDLKRVTMSLERAVGQLVKRVTEVKNASLTSQSLTVSKEACEITELISRCIRYFGGPATSRSIQIKWKNSPSFSLQADAALLDVALCNVLSNALRFTPNNGTIEIILKQSAGFAEIMVSDTGIGIAKSQREAIFNKFFENVSIMQHSSGETGFQSAGLGLGLSSARAIARAHGGDITVVSEENKGSTFTISIPL